MAFLSSIFTCSLHVWVQGQRMSSIARELFGFASSTTTTMELTDVAQSVPRPHIGDAGATDCPRSSLALGMDATQWTRPLGGACPPLASGLVAVVSILYRGRS